MSANSLVLDNARLNIINSDNYSIDGLDSLSNSESDCDDETMEGNGVDNDAFNLDEEDQDVTITQSFDEIKINKMNFSGANS
ncbi:unnamed protein product [Rotaria magnacalcarata]|uniref:Uncharacterized protein n=1 Tax=Rotaria magnacalcarata TaxID=392030 RepID=A0A820MTA7_9BILA|nr:unnamed protein product [Rotaria magnacalcarata]CAF4379252.1 unnamed protein product [Rotaria magnacalcarata]